VEKKFREGSLTRVRVLGVRHLEGVALGTLKVINLSMSLFTFEYQYTSPVYFSMFKFCTILLI
jgi:hypothetical protein